MKQCLAVLNVGNVLCPNAADSLAHAAARWGAEFRVLEQSHPGYHPAYSKHLGYLDVYDRVLFSDADILIRSDAPSPFERFAEPRAYYAAQDFQQHYSAPERERIQAKSYDAWHGVLPLTFPLSSSYMVNTGFCLYSPHYLRRSFERFRALLPDISKGGRGHPHAEQYLWNCVLREQTVMVLFTGEEWNRLRPDLQVPMNRYVYHFTGYNFGQDHREQIGTYCWRV